MSTDTTQTIQLDEGKIVCTQTEAAPDVLEITLEGFSPMAPGRVERVGGRGKLNKLVKAAEADGNVVSFTLDLTKGKSLEELRKLVLDKIVQTIKNMSHRHGCKGYNNKGQRGLATAR